MIFCCKFCNKQFNSIYKNAQYCSQECFRKSRLGIIKDEETKIKISNTLKGRKLSEETKQKMRLNRVGMLGKKHSQKTKDMISKNRKNKCCGKNNYNYGKKLSNKHKDDISKTVSELWNNGIYDNRNYCGNPLDKHPNWKGGLSYLPYCFKFNKELKEEIRERDNRICQLCGKTEEENGRKLDVHHIHYDKENCYPDLITLCNSCNIKANFNRDYWINVYMKILEKRGLLNYFGNII